MELNEHKVARTVVKDEVLSMIEDFIRQNPKLQDCEWEEGGKNYTFKKRIFQQNRSRTLRKGN